MKLYLLIGLSYLMISCMANENDYCERDEHGACKKQVENTCDNDDEPCFEEDEEEHKDETDGYPYFAKLTRMDGGKVGTVQKVNIDGIEITLTTRSLKPLLFEITGALTEDEIEHTLEKASNQYYTGGLEKSEARGGLTPEDSFKPSAAAGKAYGPAGQFRNWDLNKDGQIDMEEAGKFCRNFNFLYFGEDDVKKMFEVIGVTEFDDGIVLDGAEFEGMNTMGIEDYLNRVMREHPKFRQRTSDQTWLPMAKEFDPVFSRIRYRFGKLFKIPHKVLVGSEHMQVARYLPHGHYHAHHDSETERATDKPCCHLTNTQTIQKHAQCRLCRFMTIMTYLKAPEEGGETAFPAADNITYSDTAFRRRGDPGIDLYNLSEHCYDSNLVVKAKRGTTVAWYNHYVDPATGWMGKLDDWSLHGGCEVRKGEKWIKNLWLTAPYAKDVDKLSMYSMEYMEKTREVQL